MDRRSFIKRASGLVAAVGAALFIPSDRLDFGVPKRALVVPSRGRGRMTTGGLFVAHDDAPAAVGVVSRDDAGAYTVLQGSPGGAAAWTHIAVLDEHAPISVKAGEYQYLRTMQIIPSSLSWRTFGPPYIEVSGHVES